MNKTVIPVSKQDEHCPECGSAIVIRSGRYGSFFGCIDYPKCHYIRPLKSQADGHIVKIIDEKVCPKCQAALVLRQGRHGMFIGCEHYPACDYIESIDKPDTTNVSCPQCGQGQLLQRISRYGKIFYSCDRYPLCRFVLNFAPVSGQCAHCHYPLLIEKRTAKGTVVLCASKLCRKPVDGEK